MPNWYFNEYQIVWARKTFTFGMFYKLDCATLGFIQAANILWKTIFDFNMERNQINSYIFFEDFMWVNHQRFHRFMSVFLWKIKSLLLTLKNVINLKTIIYGNIAAPYIWRKVFWDKSLICFIFRSILSQMFFKIGVLKNLANFTEKHLYWSLFLRKFIKRRLQWRCFPVKFTMLLIRIQ